MDGVADTSHSGRPEARSAFPDRVPDASAASRVTSIAVSTADGSRSPSGAAAVTDTSARPSRPSATTPGGTPRRTGMRHGRGASTGSGVARPARCPSGTAAISTAMGPSFGFPQLRQDGPGSSASSRGRGARPCSAGSTAGTGGRSIMRPMIRIWCARTSVVAMCRCGRRNAMRRRAPPPERWPASGVERMGRAACLHARSVPAFRRLGGQAAASRGTGRSSMRTFRSAAAKPTAIIAAQSRS